jgi:hypothetical protein
MEVNIVLVVDVADFISSNGDAQYIHMVDNVKGSTDEGGHELASNVVAGDNVRWSIVAVSPSDQIEITGFTCLQNPNGPDGQPCEGAFGRNGIMNTPQKNAGTNRAYWESSVQSRDFQDDHYFQYSVSFNANGHTYTFDPFLKVVRQHELVA